MTEFKQIIGRGTRVRDDYDKFFFNILDYTGSATRLFADPEFDGEPALLTEEAIDERGELIPNTYKLVEEEILVPTDVEPIWEVTPTIPDDSEGRRRKYYVDGGHVEIAAHLVYELDTDGKQLRVVKLTDYTAEKVRTLYPSAIELRRRWSNPEQRSGVIALLEERGINFEDLASAANQPEADPFDLVCHIAFNAPLRTRRERADWLRKEKKDFFDQYGPEAKVILNELLDKYADYGTAQFVIPDILRVPPISQHGNVIEIAAFFGGAQKLKEAVNQLQTLLYAA
jgi:type I restriction enzyme R subunit